MLKKRCALALPVLLAFLSGCGPTARFTASNTGGDAPLTVEFESQSATLVPLLGNVSVLFPIQEYRWTFGDGGGSFAPDQTYTYTDAGVFDVSLTVTNAFGSDTLTQEDLIRVTTDPPQAGFTTDTTSGALPLTVTFTDTSTGGGATITHYSWDFGDGNTSVQKNPTHIYETPGVFDVSLTITTTAGTSTISEAGLIKAGNPPAAAFQFRAAPGNPLQITFDNDSDLGSADAFSTVRWEFGDGEVSAEVSPVHTYEESGIYSVVLTVTTQFGSSAQTREVRVAQTGPVASFSFEQEGENPRRIAFTDTSSPGSQPITSRLWVFDDGGTSTEQNPLHTFAAAGSYEVSLTVNTIIGGSTARQTVTVP